ncbi:hypothetical protein Ahy_B10g100733 [Arachis hypogaea]|uniref:RNase H type-1 domain-containing protein n=1 Tax=Arachis hypogaea TaxID=3818 RepID=A0A444WXG5_ARAHY|nr:hypothetical protein Ahy_B10g100733 [Arachis hypogaea]
MGKTLIESDNLKLIQAIKSKGSIGEISAIIQDIDMLMEQLPEKGLTWTPRNGNLLAHEIAKAVEIETLHYNWSTQPPANIHIDEGDDPATEEDDAEQPSEDDDGIRKESAFGLLFGHEAVANLDRKKGESGIHGDCLSIW